VILSTTYRDHTTAGRDLLAAFSPLDHATTAGLTAAEVDAALDRLLRRLAVLAALHGGQVPAVMLTALADPGDADVVDLAAAYLEHGDGRLAGCPSEIQQELVHFSRIVDIGRLGLDAGAAEHAVRRLRGSAGLPDSLKVLSELMIVTRARLAQRGRLLPSPWLRPVPAAEADVRADLTIAAPADGADYWMAIRCGRRRIRRQFRYELSALLDYLTPAEAALALWAYCHEQQLPCLVQVTVVQADASDGITIVSWDCQPGRDPGTGDAVALVAAQLPAVTRLEPGRTAHLALGEASYTVLASRGGPAIVEDAASGTRAATLAAPARSQAVTVAGLARRARDLLDAYAGPDLASIEAAHIHLDRDLDVDQRAGAAIGAAALRLLGDRQQRPPELTPMMDDDHVLVHLTPAAYRQFLDRELGHQPMHLICESSPVIRSIAVALFARLTQSKTAARFQVRGGNLFLPLPDGSHCELFEALDGDAPVTGCAFFEAALLTYRCDPARFDDYFLRRYRLPGGVHDHAALLLSGSQPHDAKVAALRAYYHRFADVTDPRRPDQDVCSLVADVLGRAAPVAAHLNVLEDYYEVQQHKVRELLRLLGLPLRLVTIHFNAVTGRVVLCDD
jgi:hypothetical protein